MQLLPVRRKRIQCNYGLFFGSFFSPTVFADRATADCVAWGTVRGSRELQAVHEKPKIVRQSVKLVRRILGLASSWCCTGLSIWYPHVCSLGHIRVCWKDSLRSLFVSSENVAFPFLQYDISRNMISYLNSEGKHQLHLILI